MKEFLLITLMLLGQIVLAQNTCDTGSCQRKWEKEIGWQVLINAREGITSDAKYAEAQMALKFEAECGCYIQQDQMMKKNFNDVRPVIIKNMEKWESAELARKTLKKALADKNKVSCPVFDKCANEEGEKKFYQYFSFTEAGGNNSAEIADFYKRCKCYAENTTYSKTYASLAEREEMFQNVRSGKIVPTKNQTGCWDKSSSTADLQKSQCDMDARGSTLLPPSVIVTDDDVQKADALLDYLGRCECYLISTSNRDPVITYWKTRGLRDEVKKGLFRDEIKKARAKNQLLEQKQNEESAKAEKINQAEQAKELLREQLIQKNRNTPECQKIFLKVNYCQNLGTLAVVEKTISREKQIGKESGFVNAKLLRDSAASKVIIQEQNANTIVQYKKLGGDIKGLQCSWPDKEKEFARNCGVED